MLLRTNHWYFTCYDNEWITRFARDPQGWELSLKRGLVWRETGITRFVRDPQVGELSLKRGLVWRETGITRYARDPQKWELPTNCKAKLRSSFGFFYAHCSLEQSSDSHAHKKSPTSWGFAIGCGGRGIRTPGTVSRSSV